MIEFESTHQRVLQTALMEKSSLDDVASNAEYNNAELMKYTHLYVKYWHDTQHWDSESTNKGKGAKINN